MAFILKYRAGSRMAERFPFALFGPRRGYPSLEVAEGVRDQLATGADMEVVELELPVVVT